MALPRKEASFWWVQSSRIKQASLLGELRWKNMSVSKSQPPSTPTSGMAPARISACLSNALKVRAPKIAGEREHVNVLGIEEDAASYI